MAARSGSAPRPAPLARPAESWAKGVAYLPGDRTAEGLIVSASVLDNLVMARPPRRGPWFDRRRARDLAEDDNSRAVTSRRTSARDPTNSLSGGNLQKLLLGKCLAAESSRSAAQQSDTRGRRRARDTKFIARYASRRPKGLAICLVSEDLNELIGLSDRILVMRAGVVAARIDDPSGASEDALIRHMT